MRKISCVFLPWIDSHLVQEGKTLPPENVTQRFVVGTHLNIFPRLREILLAGGLQAYSPDRGTLQPEHNGISPNVKWIEGKRIRSDPYVWSFLNPPGLCGMSSSSI